MEAGQKAHGSVFLRERIKVRWFMENASGRGQWRRMHVSVCAVDEWTKPVLMSLHKMGRRAAQRTGQGADWPPISGNRAESWAPCPRRGNGSRGWMYVCMYCIDG